MYFPSNGLKSYILAFIFLRHIASVNPAHLIQTAIVSASLSNL